MSITDDQVRSYREVAAQAGDDATVILASITLGDWDEDEVASRISEMRDVYAVSPAELRAMTPAQARERLAVALAAE